MKFWVAGVSCLLVMVAAYAFAQEPESPTIDAAKKGLQFPAEWFGRWKGEVTSRNTSNRVQTFQMELIIGPTEKPDRFQWTIIYDGDQGRSERAYHLVAKDPIQGQYIIDENNGIELDANLIGDSLFENFSMGGQRLWVSTQLVKSSTNKEIRFELVSADETQIRLSGGQGGVPEVKSLGISNRQSAILKPVAIITDKSVVAANTTWQKLETETYRGKQDDIFFVNERIGWYVNGAGKIFKTTDAGESWSMQLHQPGTYFRCIAFIDEQRGFAGNIGPDYFPNVTDSNPLYETTDGGSTWSAVKSIDGPPVTGLCALQVLKEPYINAGVLDRRVRVIGVGRVGGPSAMIYSDDFGKTWLQSDISEKAAMAFDVHFFNRNEGFIAAASSADTTQSNALILSTKDGGKTWTNAWQSKRPFELTWKMSFPTREVGYVTIQSYNPDPMAKERFVAKTTDGGKTWEELSLVSDHRVREFGIAFLDAKTGWVGAMPNGFHTTDGGLTWVPVEMGNAVNKIRIMENDRGHVGYAIGVNVHRLEIPRQP